MYMWHKAPSLTVFQQTIFPPFQNMHKISAAKVSKLWDGNHSSGCSCVMSPLIGSQVETIVCDLRSQDFDFDTPIPA